MHLKVIFSNLGTKSAFLLKLYSHVIIIRSFSNIQWYASARHKCVVCGHKGTHGFRIPLPPSGDECAWIFHPFVRRTTDHGRSGGAADQKELGTLASGAVNYPLRW
jgi:hypothetical protein